jgi:hypothetical protein
MATYEDHVEGVLDAFNVIERVAYSIDALPDVLPPAYIEISVTRRVGGVERFSGVKDGRLHRVVARAVGKTVPQTYRMWDLIDALEDTMLTIGGQLTTPVQFETDDEVITPDAGWFSGAKSLAYALI